ncbi:hypothetical protein [Rhodoligotrophos defluvii]|uniref:hypothetical protein n=1 Tax=Rhodoligotrophos defluvii TaxID=2561934 RepID=UPI0010C9774C|nr:hypothetical protein [Rhodoligotrophos defluvii]
MLRRNDVPLIHRRGLTREEAAAYVGLSPQGFDKARNQGLYPEPTLAGRRWDRRLLDRALDRLSGLSAITSDDPYTDWKNSHHASPS